MFGGGSHYFTWSAPDGSTSIQRGTISTTMSSTMLVFEAQEGDTGTFTCTILGATGAPAAATITVGNKTVREVCAV